jgi:hypothetical protein
MTPPRWLRLLVVPLDVIIGVPLMLLGTVVFFARWADDRLVSRPRLQRLARLASAIAISGGAYMLGPPLALVVAVWCVWRLDRAGALAPRSTDPLPAWLDTRRADP